MAPKSDSIHIANRFSRCASASAAPTIGHLRELKKVARTVRASPVRVRIFPPKGNLRLFGYADASCRNNPDASSQRGQCIFLAEPRTSGKHDARGSLIDYESQKIKRTTLSTTVSELYYFMKCFGSAQFLRSMERCVSTNSRNPHAHRCKQSCYNCFNNTSA